VDIKHEEVLALLISSGVSDEVAGIEYDASLSDAGADSLDISNFFLCLEEKFNVKVLDEDIDELDTVNAIVSYMRKK